MAAMTRNHTNGCHGSAITDKGLGLVHTEPLAIALVLAMQKHW